MIYKDASELFNSGAIKVEGDNVEIVNEELFREKVVDNLADTIILNNSVNLKRLCYWIIYQAAIKMGVIPSSIHTLYRARAKDNLTHFTVPAMNLRTLTYGLSRAIFRVANRINAGTFIFEIAKSEIGYTAQRPVEYVSCILLAAMKEGFKGPVFIQGDHFQVKTKNFLTDRDKEINGLRDLITEAIAAGFYNIDIDSSTLVDLSKPTIDEQQKLNYGVCASLTKFIRGIQPEGIEVSVGGEIGEIGGKNSTPDELRVFMKGYLSETEGAEGISKISIQTGATHGGVVLPDGSIAKVNIDFDTLKNLSIIARKEFGMAGAVQHGASTLPNDAFHHFPEVECAEIHLATQFQNIVYDYFPIPLKEKIYAWLNKELASERKPDQTNDQFIYKTRKKALGQFKREIYSLPQDVKNKIFSVLEDEFAFLFDKLSIQGTKPLVDKYVKPVVVKKKRGDFLKEEEDLGNLEGAD